MKQLCVSLCAVSLLATGLHGADRDGHDRRRHQENHKRDHDRGHGTPDGRLAVRDAVNAEFFDIARALRSLDQSYAFKGISSSKAFTAGSCFIDPMHRCRSKVSLLGPCVVERNNRGCRETCWPLMKDCLVFHWDRRLTHKWTAHGDAHVDHVGLLELSGGSLEACSEAAKRVLKNCRESGQLTVEAVFKSYDMHQRGPARILSYSSGTQERNFTLGQEGRKLIFRLRTTQTDLNGVDHEMELGEIAAGRWHHVLVSYKDGELVCLLDGRETLKTDNLQGSFANWTPQTLLFGDEVGGGRDWRGSVERIAIYRCFLDRRTSLASYLNATAPKE